MRQHLVGLLVSLATAAVPLATNAQTGNDLLNHCRSEPGFSTGFCLGFIVGHASSYNDARIGGALYRHFAPNVNAEELARRKPEVDVVTAAVSQYCLPEKGTQGQLQDVVVKYLESQPSRRHLPAGILVTVALAEAFPCR